MKIRLPYKFTPRKYQLPFLDAMDSGIKRAVQVWPRRSGKDKTDFNFIIKKASERIGGYYIFAPTYKQGRKIVWDAIDSTGFRMLDHIPKQFIKGTNKTEQKIDLINGSFIQIIGTDNIDSIVGTNPVGIVFTEYSIQNPAVWAFVQPILEENDGWAVFNFTARGKNHAYRLYEYAMSNPEWFCEKLDAHDVGVFTPERLEKIRLEYMANYGDDALFYQEYFNRWEVPIMGAYYGKQMNLMHEEKRITRVPLAGGVVVHTIWDLGVDDSNSIIFVQQVGKEYRFVDFYETNGEGLAHYAAVLQQKQAEHGYVYGRHFAPHDIKVRELGTGKSRIDTARELGINFNVVPQVGFDVGIERARAVFNQCWFDEKKCEKLINALSNYHHEYDEKNKIYRKTAKHDWSSHAADAFRYFAVAMHNMSAYTNPSLYQPTGGVESLYEGMTG